MGSAANPDYFRQVTGVRTKQSPTLNEILAPKLL